VPIIAFAAQHSITGSDLGQLVREHLVREGITGRPIIRENRVFSGCADADIIISKRQKSWKTLTLQCKTNEKWNYTFRNILVKSDEPKVSNSSENYLEKKSIHEMRSVFVLKNAKIKGEMIEQADLILTSKKKILSNRAFDDLKLVIGKRLKISLKKGAILKETHLSPDWLVHKNQKITIENNVGGIYVSMEGIALSNGIKGDRILVRNISSNKTVEGFVKGEKKISIFRKIY
jgi:flagella basal body P-ring formation protein FlgA